MLQGTNLRKLQIADLYILLEVKRICTEHDIPYFLIGGTLLGAVRHKGFIPWDDDVDVGMLRDDYEKFISVCSHDLRSAFILQTKETDMNYPNPWAKIRLRGTSRLEEGYNYESSITDTQGIDIDIFPFDNLPKSELKQWFISLCLKVSRSLYRYRCGCHIQNKKISIAKKLLLKFYNILYHLISKEQLSKNIDYLMKKYNDKQTNFVINYVGAYSYQRERVNIDVVSKLIELPFEQNTFSCPLEYDRYLKNVYGNDYMDIPKKEDRIQHNILELNLGEYADIDKIPLEKLSDYSPKISINKRG